MKKNFMIASILSSLVKQEESGKKFKGFTAKGNREMNKKLNEERKIMEVK